MPATTKNRQNIRPRAAPISPQSIDILLVLFQRRRVVLDGGTVVLLHERSVAAYQRAELRHARHSTRTIPRGTEEQRGSATGLKTHLSVFPPATHHAPIISSISEIFGQSQ